MDLGTTLNSDYIDAQYRRWQADPNSVSRDWRFFFQGFETAAARPPAIGSVGQDFALRQSRVQALIYRYREIGHLLACLDPLAACPTEHPLLSLKAFGLSSRDLEREFFTRFFSKSGRAPLREIIQALRQTYCRAIGVEYMHLQDPGERRWLQERMEAGRNRPALTAKTRYRILERLTQAALFEKFLNKKFVGVTRFSLEGGDALIPALGALVARAAGHQCREIILGMAHRGRLNVQAHILNRPYAEIFGEFENCYDPGALVGAGDVKYHNGYLADVATAEGHRLRLFLMNNPSHLESVNPVVEGFTRARQDLTADGGPAKVLPLLMHGDAAFSGQGIVTETLNMSQLEGYRTGGTIHLVINNQIGYTTLPENARSTRYPTDVAKMLMVPIFHVHGEDPEAVVHIARLAADYRWRFGKDVVIDLICYRRYGHNEGDEPYFTQPLMYDRIRQRPSLHRMYADRLLEQGVIRPEQIDQMAATINDSLENAYAAVHGSECPFPESRFYENWGGLHGQYSSDPIETGVDKKRLLALARKLNRVPAGFNLNPKLDRFLKKRLQAVQQALAIDWANAEGLAFASLLLEGHPVRLSGQDCRRGTFSQRHSVLVDVKTGKHFVPLQSLGKNQAAFQVFDSLLSESGVLGFEYGYSLAQPRGLVLWEAQFGDFVNNAQSIVDLFIAAAEAKWQRQSGLLLLLPHGFEGLGPEHSSARPERFLQLCAADNLQVCNPTSPAQYFHLLRRQAKVRYRKPLVILTPKSLLRHPQAVSRLEDLAGGSFQPVLDDPARPLTAQRVLFCSGKIFYELLQRRDLLAKQDTTILRCEQLYPFAANRVKSLLKKYRRAASFYWVQEEPENMGAWQFVRPRLEALAQKRFKYIGRPAAPVPATGFPAIFKREQQQIIANAVGAKAGQREPALVS